MALSGCMSRTRYIDIMQDNMPNHDLQPSGCMPARLASAEEHRSTPACPIMCFRSLTKSLQQKRLRVEHPIKHKRDAAAVRAAAQLPSDADPHHTYGCLPGFRSMEMVRIMGYSSALSDHNPISHTMHLLCISHMI